MSSAPPPPSYEELAALVVELKLLVSAQAATIAEPARPVRRTAMDAARNQLKPLNSYVSFDLLDRILIDQAFDQGELMRGKVSSGTTD